MLIGEGQRRALHDRLVEVLGVDQADVLMEHLPPSGWGDVARRADLDHLERILRTDMESMETRLNSKIDGLASRIDGLALNLDAGLASLGGELRAEVAAL